MMSNKIAMPETKSKRALYKPHRRLNWETCLKNPGHKEFIPVKHFGREHLPVEYRHEAVMKRVGLIVDLSCRIYVGSKSIRRRSNRQLFRDVSKYRYGTGNVVEIIKTKSPRTQKCKICNRLHKLTEGFYVIRIMTACHVVFNCKEAENTKIDLFYDDDVNLKDIKTLHGFCMFSRNIEEDQCIFECTTDDFNLVTLLEKKLSSFKKLVRECSFIYSAPCNIMASHPHGMSKHISVGTWRYIDQQETLLQSVYCQSFPGDSCLDDIHGLAFSLPHSLGPVLVSNKPESESVSIECDVSFPDMTTKMCHVWQWDNDVRCTKDFLIKEGNLHGDPDQFYLELVLPNEETQVMRDDTCLDYYRSDLSVAYRIVVKEKPNEAPINTE